MKIKFAIIGCGRISKRHLELLSQGQIQGAELVAVCDILLEPAQAAGEKFNVPFFTSFEALLKGADFNVATILTPSGMHPEHAIAFLNAGKHVVVEKPMALKMADADAMVAAAQKNGRELFVVKQNRYNVPVTKLSEALKSKRFGRLLMGTVRVRWCRDQKYYDQDSWRGTWAMDGGVFTNQASHHVDLLNWVMGGDIESVYAQSDTFLVKTETEDTGVAIIRYKNGSIGLIEATTAVRPKDLEGSVSVMGSEGSVEIAGFAVNEIKHWNFKTPIPADAEIREKFSVNPPSVYGYGHQAYLQDVVRCLNGEIKNPVDGVEGKKSLELITAIYESIETKMPVHFPFTPKKSKLGHQLGHQLGQSR